ncbi:hypothetical protein BT63DRAFT_450889 [Microthyrium microscopicum]|uniref:Uncharacterized protein n=1 Tax=Microthyrium microscopicum TaxID=703497 RepID=A0A6A6UKR2_9PEZI|nr:hypothetical protein BT63DRAFT_450889 [Microthyrium microscopicum]
MISKRKASIAKANGSKKTKIRKHSKASSSKPIVPQNDTNLGASSSNPNPPLQPSCPTSNPAEATILQDSPELSASSSKASPTSQTCSPISDPVGTCQNLHNVLREFLQDPSVSLQAFAATLTHLSKSIATFLKYDLPELNPVEASSWESLKKHVDRFIPSKRSPDNASRAVTAPGSATASRKRTSTAAKASSPNSKPEEQAKLNPGDILWHRLFNVHQVHLPTCLLVLLDNAQPTIDLVFDSSALGRSGVRLLGSTANETDFLRQRYDFSVSSQQQEEMSRLRRLLMCYWYFERTKKYTNYDPSKRLSPLNNLVALRISGFKDDETVDQESICNNIRVWRKAGHRLELFLNTLPPGSLFVLFPFLTMELLVQKASQVSSLRSLALDKLAGHVGLQEVINQHGLDTLESECFLRLNGPPPTADELATDELATDEPVIDNSIIMTGDEPLALNVQVDDDAKMKSAGDEVGDGDKERGDSYQDLFQQLAISSANDDGNAQVGMEIPARPVAKPFLSHHLQAHSRLAKPPKNSNTTYREYRTLLSLIPPIENFPLRLSTSIPHVGSHNHTMSDDIAPGALLQIQQQQPSKDELINLARNAIESSREIIRHTGDGGLNGEPLPQQQPGTTVDLCHKRIITLPDEVIEIIRGEIERLAISHNNISAFPSRLEECKRLRYLNGRHNRLREMPKPVLQLQSLEILDLSRNKIRFIPDEIRSMTSLKVLALQRNRIDRLPLCLGEMSALRILKVNENPLIFPPVELCALEDEQSGVLGMADRNKMELAVTQRIKKYLQQHSGSSARGRSNVANIDSDGELSEGTAETPRPFRPIGTRFPVRPSISGLDSMLMPSVPSLSTSPEPPPIPTRSHERIRSNQTVQLRGKASLLSPPDPSMPLSAQSSFHEFGSDITARKKRHGIITPRGPEGMAQQMALSPSALQEAFSNIGSRPASRAGSAVSSSSFTNEKMIDTTRVVYHAALDLYRRMNSISRLPEVQNQPTLKAQVEFELKAANTHTNALTNALGRSPKESNQGVPQRYLIRPMIDVLSSMASLSRLLSQTASIYCRSCTQDSFRYTFWNSQRDTWEIYVANFGMSDAIKSVNHSRQTSTSSQYLQPFQPETARLRPSPLSYQSRPPGRNGYTTSPTGSAYSGVTLPANMSNVFSPTTSVNTVTFSQDPSFSLREEDLRQEVQNDGLWEEVCRLLHILCDTALENLPKVLAHYRSERQKLLRQYDADNDFVKSLGSLSNRCAGLIELTNALARRMEALIPNDRVVRHSLEFWSYPRIVFLEWQWIGERSRQLPVLYNGEIKPVMKPIHHIVKAASTLVQGSPWRVYLEKSNYMNGSEGLQGRPIPGALTIQAHSSNFGSVPSTPLSAALGPAAAAAVPSKNGMGRQGINFFDRENRYATASTQRQPDSLYGKRGM